MPTKVSIGEALNRAFKVPSQLGPGYWLLTVKALAYMTTLMVILVLTYEVLSAYLTSPVFEITMLLGGAVILVLMLAGFSAWAVSLHRFAILAETPTSKHYFEQILAPRCKRFTIRLIQLFLAVMVAVFVVIAVLNSLGLTDEEGTLAALIIMIVGYTIVIRHMFMLPAVATGDMNTSWKEARQSIRGSAWPLFWTLFVVAIPFRAASKLLELLTGSANAGAMATTLAVIGEILITSIGVTVTVTALSFVYRQAKASDREAPEIDDATPS